MGALMSTKMLKRRIVRLGGVYSYDIDAMTRQQLREEYMIRKQQRDLYIRSKLKPQRHTIYYSGRRILPFGRRCHNY